MLSQLLILAISGFYISSSHASCMDCCNAHKEVPGEEESGPGYSSPEAAICHHKREEILYVTSVSLDSTIPDYLSVINVDPQSTKYSKVISRLYMPKQEVKDELRHFGWNTCSSCHHDKSAMRNKLILPCLNSDRIHVVDTTNEKCPRLHKTIQQEELYDLGLSTPHSSHCLPTGEIMISTMGDGLDGNAKGQFIMLDGKKDFAVNGTFSNFDTEFGHDFWYQPYFDIMVSSEFGAPRSFKKGFNINELEKNYGHSLHFWSWNEKKLIKTIDLGTSGWMPLEVRFFHNPYQPHGYVTCALSSTIYHINNKSGEWCADKVVTVPAKTVNNWWVGLDTMPALMVDQIISMDDKFLYVSNWLHGDIRQYNICLPDKPKLVGQVFVGGSIVAGGPVTVVNDPELECQPEPLFIKGKRIEGGPHMMQLSLDGLRLYVTTSMYSVWDKQFYPELVKKGSCLIQIDVNTEEGGLAINKDFLVDFGSEPAGPALAHQIRYPGGDCTSDIFVPNQHQHNCNEQ